MKVGEITIHMTGPFKVNTEYEWIASMQVWSPVMQRVCQLLRFKDQIIYDKSHGYRAKEYTKKQLIGQAESLHQYMIEMFS